MNAIRALLQFCTVLPLGSQADFEAFAKRSYLYPVAGYVIGGITAVLAGFVSDSIMAAALALSIALFLSGFNHFDGLLDFGDSLMAHGSREKRIAALTDRQIGAGGVAMGITVTLLAFAGLQAATSIAVVILIAEVCAKISMASLTALGTPFKDGLHKYLYDRSRKWFPVAAFLLGLPLLLLPVSPGMIGAALVTTGLVVVILILVSRQLFGGVSGDIVGAANEITRMAVILILSLGI